MSTPARGACLLVPALLLAPVLVACGSDGQAGADSTFEVIDMGEGRSSSPHPTASAGARSDAAPIDRATRQRLSRLAVDEVGGGHVEEVERSDDSTHAYEVEVELLGDDVTVLVSDEFVVVGVDE